MNFSERPQLACQGPGNNIKKIKRGKIPEPYRCHFHSFLLGLLTRSGLVFFSSVVPLGHFPLPFSPPLYRSPKHKPCVYDTEQSWFQKFFWFVFFFKDRSLDKTQPWLQLEAAGISVPCFNAWPLSWNPGEFLGVGMEEKEEEREERREPLHPKWDSQKFTAVFSGDR